MRVRITSARRVRAGFTLMEMMVVVAIIVGLAGLGIYYMAGQADEGTKAAVKAKVKSLTDTAVIYKTQHNGEWPQSLQQLTQPDGAGRQAYLSQEDILDPWEKPYQYDPSGGNNGGRQPDIFCVTPWGTIGNWSRKIQ